MIRIATVGTSSITGLFIEAARASGRIEVVACYSRDAAKAAAYAAEQGVGRSFDDLAAMASEPDIDAVYVASPNAAHAAQVRLVLEAGKHVLCEKSITPTAPEAEPLYALAAERGLVLLEALRSIWDPGMDAVRAWLPRLGTLRRASLRYEQRSARYDKVLAGEQVNIFDPALGGGGLSDLGVYVANILVDLFGAPDRVVAGLVPVATGADGAGVALACYPGLVVDVDWSKITVSSVPTAISGELGTLLVDHIDRPRHLVVEWVDGRREEQTVEAAENNMQYEAAYFADLVESGNIAEQDAARSVGALRFMDTSREVG